MYYVMHGNTRIGPFWSKSSAAHAANGYGYYYPSHLPKQHVVDRHGETVDISRYTPVMAPRSGGMFGLRTSVHNPSGLGYAAIQRPVHRGDWLRALFGRYS